jgi:C1A family cysteine protease
MSILAPKLGSWLRDEEDSNLHENFKDQLSGLILEGSSNECDLRKWCSPIEDQQVLSSCVGNAVVGAFELLRIRAGLQHEDLSRLFVYYNSRAQHGAELRDDGTYIRMCFKSLQTLGVCKEENWPYDVNKVLVRPSWKALREAYCYKIKSFSRILDEGSGRNTLIENAIRSGHPVVFGMLVDQAFVENITGVIEFGDSFVSKGSHAMVIVGFNASTRTFIIRNSWGRMWGSDGYAALKYEYLDLCNANDFWVCTGIN